MPYDLLGQLTDKELEALEIAYKKIINMAMEDNTLVKKMLDKDLFDFLHPLLINQMASDLQVEESEIESLFIIKLLKESETNDVILSIKKRMN